MSARYLSNNYKPNENEPYMSVRMLAYFKNKLIEWRNLLVYGKEQVSLEMSGGIDREADPIDTATNETHYHNVFILHIQRDENLLLEIANALDRINNGTYGYCLKTGDPIGLRRLEAWPIALLSLEAQLEKEKGRN